jgi:hypothetical protein
LLETDVEGARLVSILDYAGMPLSAHRVVEGVLNHRTPVPA